MCLIRRKKKAQTQESTACVNEPITEAQEMYQTLLKYDETLRNLPYKTEDDPDEGISIISEVIYGWWKQRWVMNHNKKTAFEFIDQNENLVAITDNDIDWDSLNGLEQEYIDRAHRHYAGFPTIIRGFNNGVANVEWQLNPDGQYFMDEDGFGMTDDVEIALWGKIDCNGHIIEKFHYK